MDHVPGVVMVSRGPWARRDGDHDVFHDAFVQNLANSGKILRYELGVLDAERATLAVDLAPTQMTRAGMPRTGTRAPSSPGVVLEFDSPMGHHRYAAGQYRTWQANVRAIALTLERLRDVRRWGVLDDEQYAGNLALPSPHDVLVRQGRDLIAQHGSARAAKAALHPDRPGGDEDAFRAVTAAEDHDQHRGT